MSSSNLSPAPGFRADINGLRAWAVVAVVLYHFGVPGLSGGFVGVDVFFVISGLLMTGIIIEALQAERFSLVKFYLARARRILPALLVLCVVLLLLGWFFLMPIEYQNLGRHARDSLLFSSNLRYLRESGYFDVGSHEKWLLHTWSLSVEWQFYLLLPLLLLGLWRLLPTRRALTSVISAVLLSSLVLCVWTTLEQPSKAFFVLQTRAWELLVGSLVYLLGSKLILSVRVRATLAWLGLLCITVAAVFFSAQMQWPGWLAVLPVTGAAMVLVARSNTLGTNSALAQWLGTRSYSIYLWHWPVVVALAYAEVQAQPQWLVFGLLVSLLLGHLSYVWVEVPSRNFLSRAGLVGGAVWLLCLLVLVGGTAQWVRKSDFPQRLPEAVARIEVERLNHNPRQGECLDKGVACVYGGEEIKAIVLGDSHADALITSIVAALPQPSDGVLFRAANSCLILPGARATAGGDVACQALNQWILTSLATTHPGVPVMLVNRLAVTVFGGMPGEEDDVPGRPAVYFSQPYSAPVPAFIQEFRERYLASICAIAKTHPVYLLRPIPEMPVNVPGAIGRALLLGRERDVSVTLQQYRSRQGFLLALQDQAVAQCGARIIDPSPFLCDSALCFGSVNGQPLYSDDDHLSETGNKRLIPMFTEMFRSR